MKFKRGDTVRVKYEGDWYLPSGIYTFGHYNPYDKDLCYMKNIPDRRPSHISNVTKINYYNSKLGKVLYK